MLIVVELSRRTELSWPGNHLSCSWLVIPETHMNPESKQVRTFLRVHPWPLCSPFSLTVQETNHFLAFFPVYDYRSGATICNLRFPADIGKIHPCSPPHSFGYCIQPHCVDKPQWGPSPDNGCLFPGGVLWMTLSKPLDRFHYCAHVRVCSGIDLGKESPSQFNNVFMENFIC